MKNYVLLICCVCFLLATGAVNAQAKVNKLDASIGLQTYHSEYTEPGIMNNEGYFYGISYSLIYEDAGILFGLEGLFAYGEVDYTSTSTGSAEGFEDICADNRIILGVSIYDDKKIQIIPFAGVAYRFLQDDSKYIRSTTNHLGYFRESNYFYSPVGIKIKMQYAKGWSLTPEFEYDFFWHGEQESETGYLAANRDNIVNDQEEGYGYRLSLTLAKKTVQAGYSFQVFYRYWDIEDSKITLDSFGAPWIEPENDTVEYGVNFSILF